MAIPKNKRPLRATGKGTPRVSKINAWLRAFLDENNPSTFLNKTASVKAAKYRCNGEPSCQSIGSSNFRKVKDEIKAWLDENGLSENSLKIKMLSLLEAKETKYFIHEGMVTDEREVPAIETQRKTLDMALKVKGMNAPEKYEHTGKDGKDLFPEMSDEDLDARISALLQG